MKAILRRLVPAVLIVVSATSCTTVYDAYGRPQEVIDPGAALIGAAAVGLLAYGLSESGHHHGHYDRYHHRGSHYHGWHGQPYRHYGGHCAY